MYFYNYLKLFGMLQLKTHANFIPEQLLRKDKNMNQLQQDPIMLYSVINTKLRDFYSSLDILCEDMNVNEKELKEKLAAVGFKYNEERNQFI